MKLSEYTLSEAREWLTDSALLSGTLAFNLADVDLFLHAAGTTLILLTAGFRLYREISKPRKPKP